MKANAIIRVLLSFAAAVLIASCTPDGGTIYTTIEKEQMTRDNSLPNAVTIGDIVKVATDTYYVAAGTIYKGTLAADIMTWTPNTSSTKRLYNPEGALTNTLSFDGTSLLGGFFTTGANLGLYTTALAPDATAWSAISDPVVTAKQVTLIQQIGTDMFVASATIPSGTAAYAWELDCRSGAGVWTTPVSGLAAPIVGIAKVGASYYMASGATVYSDSSPTGTFATVATTVPAGDTATSLFGNQAGTRAFLTTSKNGLYVFNGTTWTQAVAPVVGTATVSLLTTAGPVDAGGDTYLVGSDGFGYYVYSLSANTLTRFSDSTIKLYSASVRRILFDPANQAVFVGTNGAGLWRTALDASGNATGAWTHE